MSRNDEILSVGDIARLIRACRRNGVKTLKLDGLSFEFWSEQVVRSNLPLNEVNPVEAVDSVDLDVLLASDPVAFEQKIKELG